MKLYSSVTAGNSHVDLQIDRIICMQARKNLHSFKRIERLQVLAQGHSVKKQASTTLSYIQSWSKIQAQIRARRICMVTEGRIRQKKQDNQLKLEAKLHDLEVGDVHLLFAF